MRKSRKFILAGTAAVLALGTGAAAAETHRMNVSLPDGSIAQVEYEGEVAPRVIVVPAAARLGASYDPFAAFDRIAAQMEAQRQAMLLRMAALQQAAAEAASANPGQMTVVGDLPAGVHYTMVSSTTDASGCTQTVRYSSDGSGEQPKVTRASTGACETTRSTPAVIEASAPARAKQAPGHET